MDLGWFAAVSGFALAMTGTPGPNNTLVTASGANYGFRRTLPLMWGITLGVVTIIMAVGALGPSLVADPRVRALLKWVGLAYLLWLSWRIGSARPMTPNAGDERECGARPLSFMQGALFQLVNPKLWIMAAGAVVTYGAAAGGENAFALAAVFVVIFGIATLASTAVWTLIGVGAGRFIRTDRTMRVFNRAMAILLVLSLIPILVD